MYLYICRYISTKFSDESKLTLVSYRQIFAKPQNL